MFWLVCRVLIWAFWSYSGQLGWLNFCVRATPSVFCFGLLSSLSRSDMAFTAVALHWNALGLNQTECFFLQWEGPFLNWKSTWSWKKSISEQKSAWRHLCFFRLSNWMYGEAGLPLWWRKFTVAWVVWRLQWWRRNLWWLSRGCTFKFIW